MEYKLKVDELSSSLQTTTNQYNEKEKEVEKLENDNEAFILT